ncbi:MAG: hypothetical protein GY847_00855 [Proteobacteria bacterium]|nr:hypothetical protein [Pseudomonadota bacterium]
MTIGAFVLLTLVGCDSGNSSSLVGEGEACRRTADCEGDLRCISQLCVSNRDRDSDTNTDTATDTDSDADPPEDQSDLIYDPATLVDVEIEMDPLDWEFVRNEERDFAGMSLSCPTGPFYSTYTWKSANVRVNGNLVENVGIRKKGFIGSVNSIKPGLKIKFDMYVEGQTPFGMERMTLNNNAQDHSQMVQCLTYQLAREAGIAASRCNFAWLRVNGEVLGLFTNVEPIKKRFLARHFEDNEGDLYEGTLSDFRDDWMSTLEPKTIDTDPMATRVVTVTEALKLPDDQLLDTLLELVDLENFATFWALNTLVNNRDSYFTKGNNFYIYFSPSNQHKMYFIPWGADAAFYSSGKEKTMGVKAGRMLARRLYLLPAGQVMYVEALNTLLTDYWDEAELLAEIDRIEELIGPAIADDPLLASGKGGEAVDFSAAVQEVRDFVNNRRAQAQMVVDNPPAWEEPLDERHCD